MQDCIITLVRKVTLSECSRTTVKRLSAMSSTCNRLRTIEVIRLVKVTELLYKQGRDCKISLQSFYVPLFLPYFAVHTVKFIS